MRAWRGRGLISDPAALAFAPGIVEHSPPWGLRALGAVEATILAEPKQKLR
jgi:hypothetical protein